jgi:tetratricopeptide (TPR) repeat protein
VTEDQQRFALRLVAFGGLWLLVSGLLLVLSFVAVAMAAIGLLLSVLIALGTVALLRRIEVGEHVWTLASSGSRAVGKLGPRLSALEVRQRLQPLGTSIGKTAAGAPMLAASGSRAVGRVGLRLHEVRVRRRLKRLGIRLGKTVADTPGRINRLLGSALRTYAIAVHRLTLVTSQLLGDAGNLSATVSLRRPRPRGGSRQALRLNELGAQLRRRGDHQRAAEQHRVALAIARDAGDERAEALTLNNLALALAQGGADAEAVRHLEQALVVLRELGDEKHEARVIANLGMVHSRQGHSEEAVTLLHEALDKLPPESTAYLQVKQELSRAS